MPPILELPLESGGIVLFEIEERRVSKTLRGSGTDANIKPADETFDGVVRRFKPLLDSLATQFRDFAGAPEQVSVELGIKFTAQAGMVITRASSDASLRLKLSWKKDR